jgi:enoyl-CoA hydratase
MNGHIDLHQADGMATVTLAHPGKLNAMSRAMWRQLRIIFSALQADTTCRSVLIRGEGAAFCAGGDIAEYPGFRFDAVSLRDFHENDVWGGLSAMLACDVPIVAAIEGACMGAGVEIVSCCDVRIAGASARFGAPIARLGFPMAPREMQLVVREAGALTARQMLLEAAVLDASTVAARGFLTQVVADDAVLASARESAARIAALAPQAARLNKQTLRQIYMQNCHPSLSLDEDDAIKKMIQTAYHYAPSAEHQEGITAFLAKRKPHF